MIVGLANRALDMTTDMVRSKLRAGPAPEEFDLIQQKIAEGKLRKWFEEVVLLNQPYFRDEDQTVEQVRAALSSEMGENIEIKRFASYALGQEQ